MKNRFMICKKCGKNNEENTKFCIYCGFKMDEKFTGNETTQSNTPPTLKKQLVPFIKWVIIIVLVLIVIGVVYYNNKETDVVIVNNNTTTTPTNVNSSFDFDSKLISEISASVVSIECEDITNEDGYSYWGSGTIWTEDGIVVTNSHVIPQTEDELLTPEYGCWVTLPDPDTGVPIEMYYADPVVVPGLSDEYDLAILEIYDVYVDEDGYAWGQYPNEFPYFDDTDYCVEEYMALGEPLKIFGYPASSGNYSLTVTEGIISNFPDDGTTILTSAKIDSGNSGGLAVDRFGCQLGVPVAVSIGEYENLGVIIDIETVFEFIDQYIVILEEAG